MMTMKLEFVTRRADNQERRPEVGNAGISRITFATNDGLML